MDSDYLKMVFEKKKDDLYIIHVNGRLDETTFDGFKNDISEAREIQANIIVNLSELKYISSLGIRSFFDLKNDQAKKKMKLVLVGADDNIIQIFSLLGLWKTFEHFDLMDDAVSFIQKNYQWFSFIFSM